jgi:hypothetical protein
VQMMASTFYLLASTSRLNYMFYVEDDRRLRSPNSEYVAMCKVGMWHVAYRGT